MNILIIGNAYSLFNTSFAKHIKKLNFNISITILNYYYKHELHEQDYQTLSMYDNVIHVHPTIHPVIAKIPVLRRYVKNILQTKRMITLTKAIHTYNVVLLQGFWKHSIELFNKLKIKNSFVVGAFWGSDFYKRDKTYDSNLQNFINRCDRVIISTDQMRDDIVAELTIDSGKLRKALFGVAPLQVLFDIQNETKSFSKKKLNFGEEAFIITCGYNASIHHQHIAIIDALNAIADQLPQHTKIVFPMTYSKQQEYMNDVKTALSGTSLDYVIYENFMSDEEVAYLRKATDIFIHLPTTDANSGSFQEHLFAKNVVITGGWLPYRKYKENGVYFEEIGTINELQSKLVDVIANFKNLQQKAVSNNTPEKFSKSLWSECIKDWYSILNEYKQYEVRN